MAHILDKESVNSQTTFRKGHARVDELNPLVVARFMEEFWVLFGNICGCHSAHANDPCGGFDTSSRIEFASLFLWIGSIFVLAGEWMTLFD